MERLEDDLVRYARAGVNVEVVGLPGSGRSAALATAAGRLQQAGWTVVKLPGMAPFRERPLAALALGGIDITPAAGPVTVVAAVAALARLLGGPRCVLVLDDADQLDLMTMGAVVAARSRTPFTVLAATRPPSPRPGAEACLMPVLQPAVRLAARPLAFADLHRLVHDQLQGPVAAPAVAAVATLSGGLPGLVRAIALTARQTGALTLADGVWQAQGPLYSDRLGAAADALVADAGEAAVADLAALALAGALPLAKAQALVGPGRLGVLEAGGFVHVAGPQAPVVTVFPPLVAEHLRRLRRSAAPGPPGLPGSRPAAQALQPGDPATWSRCIFDHWRAETELRLARWDADPVPETAVPLLVALHLASQPADLVRAVIDETDKAASDLAWRLRLAVWEAVHLAVTCGDLAGALARLAAARQLHPDQDPLWEAVGTHLTLLRDRVPPPLAIPPGDGPLAGLAAGAEAECRLAQGQALDALALLDGWRPGWPFLARHRDVLKGLALLLAGRLDEAAAWSGRGLAEARADLVPAWMQAHGYVHALAQTLLGDFTGLDATTAALLTLTSETTLYEDFQSGFLALAALAHAWAGQPAYAQALARQAAAPGRLGPYPAMLSPIAPDAVAPGPGAGERLWEAARDRLDRGYLSAAVVAAVIAAEAVPAATPPGFPAQVHAAAAKTQSPVLRALGAYAGALGLADPDALRAAQADLHAANLTLPALRAGVHLAVALRRQGKPAAAAAAARDAYRTAAGVPGPARRHLFRPLAKSAGLSAREAEVAGLAATGATAAQIAETLTLSVHTVQNHLAAAYRKAGVTTRVELAEAVGSWLAPAAD